MASSIWLMVWLPTWPSTLISRRLSTVRTCSRSEKCSAFLRHWQSRKRKIGGENSLPRLHHRDSSRISHALANSQSRSTVLGEIFNTSTISSTFSPPKKRNSTTLACWGAICPSASSASFSAKMDPCHVAACAYLPEELGSNLGTGPVLPHHELIGQVGEVHQRQHEQRHFPVHIAI